MQVSVWGPGTVPREAFFSKSMLEQSNLKSAPDVQTVQVAQDSVPIVMEHWSNANPAVENSAQTVPTSPDTGKWHGCFVNIVACGDV